MPAQTTAASAATRTARRPRIERFLLMRDLPNR
jgi:hypothetical protein